MVKVSGLKPHPAFDLSVLPTYKATTTASAAHGHPAKAKEPHYPMDYLESLDKIETPVDSPLDLLGWAAMTGARAISWLVAVFRPLWLLDNVDLNLLAFMARPHETVFLRRILLLEGIAWTHGLAVAYSANLRGILSNHPKLELVQPMLGEFQDHRVHMLSFFQVLHPAIFTRVLILVMQALLLPIYFGICLVYPPACHAIARQIAGLSVELYTEAIEELDEGRMTRMAGLTAPPIAQWFYSLPPDAPFRTVLLCIRADDCFHAVFNEVCEETHCVRPTTKMEPHMDVKSQ